MVDMRVPLFNALLAAALAILMSGCDSVFGDGYEVRIRMDASEYAANTETLFSMTVDNRSDNVVYYLCAGEVFIERIEDDDLQDTNGALPNCDCLCPRPIEPRQTETWNFTLDQWVIDWIQASPNTDDTEYRFRLKLYEDEAFEKELDLSDQRSNEFQMIAGG
jgi:hypothetical protein